MMLLRTVALAMAFVGLGGFVAVGEAQAAIRRYELSIPRQALDTALKDLAQQTGLQIARFSDSVDGAVVVGPLIGQLSAEEALKSLLSPPGLSYKVVNERTIAVLNPRESVPAPSPFLPAQQSEERAKQSLDAGGADGAQRNGVGGSPSSTSPQQTPAPQRTEEKPPAQEKKSDVVELVVTGTRIAEDGYRAPTPVTVLSAENLFKAEPTGLVQALRQAPQFVGSTGPTQGARFAQRGTALNLRGLGAQRNLILLDGERAPATSFDGTVNIDSLLPQLLVKRVDIVTSGASAAYGSDAVSGVVNFILDKSFTGWRGVAQGGVTSRGDNENYRAGLAWGGALGERAHLLLDAEVANMEGFLMGDRPELVVPGSAVGSVIGGGPAGSAGNPLIFLPDTRFGLTSNGGLSLTGPFAQTAFITPGVYRPVIRGTPTGTPILFQAPSDYAVGPTDISAAGESRTSNAFARFSYDVSEDTSVYTQAMFSRNIYRAKQRQEPFFTSTTQTIFSGNAFLAPALQAQLTNANVPSFQLTKWPTDLGPALDDGRTNFYSATAGIDGKVGRFKWGMGYVYGKSVDDTVQTNAIELTRLAAAVDAVVDPGTGATVCRASLSIDPAVAARYAGCAPFNLFGYGAASPAAQAYVTATPSTYRAEISSHNIGATLSGDLFALPAGQLAAVLGVSYRSQDLEVASNSAPDVLQNISGLRGIGAGTQRFATLNTATARGSNNFREVFGEIAVPILAELPFARSLDVNGAFRITDYSTTGSHNTWKLGATWSPVDSLFVRATRSRDLRAPTLYDQFAGPRNGQGVGLDPHTGTSVPFRQITSGNPNLVPEVGTTTSFGFTYQPEFVSGLALSVDYYNLEITDAIATLTAVRLLQDCEATNGASPSCANIIRPLPFSDHSAANAPTQVTVSGVNVALLQARGIDFDLTYKTALAAGTLGLRLYANYTDRFSTQETSVSSLINYAGYSDGGTGGVAATIPKSKAVLSANYELGPLSIFVQESMIGRIKLGPLSVYNEPPRPAYFTTDLTVGYRIPQFSSFVVFGSVSDVFDKSPPPLYGVNGPLGLSTVGSLYNTIGRAFVVGTRMSF